MDDSPSEILTRVLAIFPFSQLTDEEAADCLQWCEFQEFAPGTRIFTPGEKADHLFFIIDGEVRISPQRVKAALGNAVLTQGDHFGEEAISGGGSRKTTAGCLTQTSLLSINRKNLISLL